MSVSTRSTPSVPCSTARPAGALCTPRVLSIRAYTPAMCPDGGTSRFGGATAGGGLPGGGGAGGTSTHG